MDHRGLAYCYTAYIYRRDINPLVNLAQRSCIPLHCIFIYIYIYIYIYIREMNPPWSFDNRGLAYHYTAYIREMNPHGQLSIEALHTITLLIYREREGR